MGWLDQFIMDIRDHQLLLFDAQLEFERYERLHTEFKEGGRDFLLHKYRKSSLTYVYRYLNSNAYEESKSTYEYVKDRFEHKQRTLEVIAIFYPDKDLINPKLYENEVFK